MFVSLLTIIVWLTLMLKQINKTILILGVLLPFSTNLFAQAEIRVHDQKVHRRLGEVKDKIGDVNNTLDKQLKPKKHKIDKYEGIKVQVDKLDDDTYGESLLEGLFKNKDSLCGPKNNSSNYQACMGERRIRAAAYEEMKALMKQMDERVKTLKKLLAESDNLETQAEQQALHTKITAYQALLQTDITRINLSLKMHQQRMELYQQQVADSGKAAQKGSGKAANLNGALKIALSKLIKK